MTETWFSSCNESVCQLSSVQEGLLAEICNRHHYHAGPPEPVSLQPTLLLASVSPPLFCRNFSCSVSASWHNRKPLSKRSKKLSAVISRPGRGTHKEKGESSNKYGNKNARFIHYIQRKEMRKKKKSHSQLKLNPLTENT